VQIVPFIHISARHAGCHKIVSHLKVSQGELRDDISPPAAILLSYDSRRGVNMFLPPHNKVSVDDNTLCVQYGVTISTDSDFSEAETLYMTLGVRFYD